MLFGCQPLLTQFHLTHFVIKTTQQNKQQHSFLLDLTFKVFEVVLVGTGEASHGSIIAFFEEAHLLSTREQSLPSSPHQENVGVFLLLSPNSRAQLLHQQLSTWEKCQDLITLNGKTHSRKKSLVWVDQLQHAHLLSAVGLLSCSVAMQWLPPWYLRPAPPPPEEWTWGHCCLMNPAASSPLPGHLHHRWKKCWHLS